MGIVAVCVQSTNLNYISYFTSPRTFCKQHTQSYYIQERYGRELNLRPLDIKSDALTGTPSRIKSDDKDEKDAVKICCGCCLSLQKFVYKVAGMVAAW